MEIPCDGASGGGCAEARGRPPCALGLVGGRGERGPVAALAVAFVAAAVVALAAAPSTDRVPSESAIDAVVARDEGSSAGGSFRRPDDGDREAAGATIIESEDAPPSTAGCRIFASVAAASTASNAADPNNAARRDENGALATDNERGVGVAPTGVAATVGAAATSGAPGAAARG
jgi:hypothetical protein